MLHGVAMKKIGIALTALTLAVGVLALGHVAAQEETVVKGRVVCKTCYLRDKSNIGQAMDYDDLNDGDPDLCAIHCARAGRPLALLTEDGKLYTITGKLAAPGTVPRTGARSPIRENSPYPELQQHFTHVVDMIGVVTEKNGEREIAANRFVWATDSKDWRVDRTLELKYGENEGVYIDGKRVK